MNPHKSSKSFGKKEILFYVKKGRVIIKKGLQKFPDSDDANIDRFRYIVAKFSIPRDIKATV